MYLLKQSPEDFLVKEIATHQTLSSGPYALCSLKKRNYTTLRAIQAIANALGKPAKSITFAGNKDKVAITEQFIAIKSGKEHEINRLKLKDIELRFMGYVHKPLSLGDLNGNSFIITVWNLSTEQVERILHPSSLQMPNYFGEQRFSQHNAEIGKLLVKSQFKQAVAQILSTNPDAVHVMHDYLEQHPTNFIEALRLLPRKQLKLYIHSYQSLLWNRMLSSSNHHGALFVPGFGTEEPSLLTMLADEGISPRHFIMRKMPELASEGTMRATHIEILDYAVIKTSGDCATVSFTLPKGAYATVAIAFLLDQLEHTLQDNF